MGFNVSLELTRLWARLRAATKPHHLVLACGLVCLIFLEIDQVRRIGDFRVDDAYITFSYSKNLALGKGPLYSHSLRVEGYSNFLWMVVVALGYPFGIDPYITARALSFVSLGVCFWSVFRVVAAHGHYWAAVASVLWLAACSDLTVAAVSGLETAAFAAALAYGWSVYLRAPPSGGASSLWAFLPVALIRIDGFVPVIIVALIELGSSLVGRRFDIRRYLLWIVPPFLVWGAYFIWRFHYYGLPLPTTYYAKEFVSLGDPDRGIRQLQSLWKEYGLMAVAWLPLISLLHPRRSASIRLIFGLLGAWGYAAYVGGDWMPFYRFLLPGMPLFAMLVGLGLNRLSPSSDAADLSVLARWKGFTQSALLVVSMLALGWTCVQQHVAFVATPGKQAKIDHAAHVERHTKALMAAMDLARFVIRQPGDRFVSDYAGVFAVFTEANVIDMWGLANREIALWGGTRGINPIYGKECAACYPDLDPHYFHPMVPLVVGPTRYKNQRQLVKMVFQGDAIDRFLNFADNYVAGYVLEEKTARTFWFLEKRRSGHSFEERIVAPGIVIRYPFEKQTR